MTTIVTVVSLVLVAVSVAAIEYVIRRSRQEDKARESAEWVALAERVHEQLALPERRALIAEATARAGTATASEQLTHLCRMTATAMDAPAAVVTVVEYEGQRWLAYSGAEWMDEDCRAGLIAPLETSYCQYVVATNETLSIEDARKDARVATSSAATKDDVRAYLGHPVTTVDGVPVGSLCVFDRKPRRWSVRDREVLRSFASLVTL